MLLLPVNGLANLLRCAGHVAAVRVQAVGATLATDPVAVDVARVAVGDGLERLVVVLFRLTSPVPQLLLVAGPHGGAGLFVIVEQVA